MATPPTQAVAGADQPHLVSLVLHSKKALQHGELLCSHAHTRAAASARAAVDVLALDARVRWISDTVLDQLKLAAGVAKSIEEKRAALNKDLQAWDSSRKIHTTTLDAALDSLGAQLVPLEFHQSSVDSSLFGSQHALTNDDSRSVRTQDRIREPEHIHRKAERSRSIGKNWMGERDRNGRRSIEIDMLPQDLQAEGRSGKDDRRKWKTLRDFVDEQAIEDILEMMENDRTELEDTLSKTDDYAETLTRTVASIKATLPTPHPFPPLPKSSLHATPASGKAPAQLSTSPLQGYFASPPSISPPTPTPAFINVQAKSPLSPIPHVPMGTIASSPTSVGGTSNVSNTTRGTPSNVVTAASHTTTAVGVHATLTAQDAVLSSMAVHLESLAAHYAQMATALRDSEAGEVFLTEDLQDMNRDTEELPHIMAELEDDVQAIDGFYEQLNTALKSSQGDLDTLGNILDDLDELGGIMAEMLSTQENIEVQCSDALVTLHRHLTTLSELHARFGAYQIAFNRLVLEIARRRVYREAAENIVRGMATQLEAMSEEENQVRAHFNAEYGAHLPEDICLCIGNAPTRWEVVPWAGDTRESLPFVDSDLVEEARKRIEVVDGSSGMESS